MWGRPKTAPRIHAIAFAILGAWLLVVHLAEVWGCPECGSSRRVSQLRIGLYEGMSLPLWPEREVIRETEAASCLVGPGHAHRWVIRWGRDGGRFLLSGTCCTNPLTALPNAFVKSWEENPAFYRLVESERAAGRLDQAEVLAIARIPSWPRTGDEEYPSLAAPQARAQALFVASGASDLGGEWEDWRQRVNRKLTVACPGPTR